MEDLHILYVSIISIFMCLGDFLIINCQLIDAKDMILLTIKSNRFDPCFMKLAVSHVVHFQADISISLVDSVKIIVFFTIL